MALANTASTAAAKFTNLSIPRQVGLLVGLAASIAIGLAVVLWSRDPSFLPIYSQMNARDSAEVASVLERYGFNFRVDPNNGILMVPADQLQAARFKLAAEGLPRDSSSGTEQLFAGNNAFNSSQFMENARYKQALEAELARTISKFNEIKAARVHLAIPRESAFVRDDHQPSASVFLDVYSGLELKKQTIASIVNLVASSIPNLNSSRVTVVDQDGQLLNEGGGQNTFSETERNLDYKQTLEKQYAQKIQDILTPLLGYGRVKAKVSADVDFTTYEQTQESFNPEHSAIRSEQSMQEKRNTNAAGASGVPGTLSNLPQPATGGLGGKNTQVSTSKPMAEAPESSDVKSQSTKNFELDKTISHTKKQPGAIKRLSVAVIIDNNSGIDPKTKKPVSKPISSQKIEQIKALVSDAIGLNTKRGDSINVLNSDFVKPDPIENPPAEKFWQSDGFWSIVKQCLGALFILAIVFGVLRPMLKTLASSKNGDTENEKSTHGQSNTVDASSMAAADYESQLELLRQIVEKEPKRVAQVVKNWVDRG